MRQSRRLPLFPVVYIFIGAIVALAAHAAQAAKVRIPRACAGVRVGLVSDADVQKLFGKGYFAADESHLGGRYYVDPAHRVTLHVMIGTDRIIDGVEYRVGVHFPTTPTARMLKAAETTRLTGSEKVDGELPLGATMHDVRARYGKPVQDAVEGASRTLVYHVAGSRTPVLLDYDVNFAFRKGRLVGVLFDVSD